MYKLLSWDICSTAAAAVAAERPDSGILEPLQRWGSQCQVAPQEALRLARPQSWPQGRSVGFPPNPPAWRLCSQSPFPADGRETIPPKSPQATQHRLPL